MEAQNNSGCARLDGVGLVRDMTETSSGLALAVAGRSEFIVAMALGRQY